VTRGKGPAISELRRRADSLKSASALRRFAAELSADGRSGARALAERCRRRASASEREQRRLSSLFALRAPIVRGGARRVAGVDEVGVGPLAGPVVAAAVVLPPSTDLPGLDDSKKLTPAHRERLDRAIREQALGIGIGQVDPLEIDRLNIYQAALQAMRRAVLALPEPPDHILVDARTIPGISVRQTPIVGGDGLDGSIAAASIVAKVFRDALMCRLDDTYPGYGFSAHKGYGTRVHLDALRRTGATPIHRRSFAPVSQLVRR
jgi:ribonuclease HII